MPPNTTPTAANAARNPEPCSAAEHCAAAEALFARARALHPTRSSRAVDQDEYQRCLEWAHLYLRLAEIITAGANLAATQLRLKADGLRMLDFHAASEAYGWDAFLGERHDTTRRSQ
ncbi:hypothetical protein [Amycolatopsis sp. NPDC051061]|uniref:hypothetical protein n=1 Tax=Amycolatopsis sp. NPDC051061 TaxID=3155042 RepID=UPI003421E47A